MSNNRRPRRPTPDLTADNDSGRSVNVATQARENYNQPTRHELNNSANAAEPIVQPGTPRQAAVRSRADDNSAPSSKHTRRQERPHKRTTAQSPTRSSSCSEPLTSDAASTCIGSPTIHSDIMAALVGSPSCNVDPKWSTQLSPVAMCLAEDASPSISLPSRSTSSYRELELVASQVHNEVPRMFSSLLVCSVFQTSSWFVEAYGYSM